MMKIWNLLQFLLLLLLVQMSKEEPTGALCEKGWRWSNDLGKCKDCDLCDPSSKDDFCQTCDSSEKVKQPDIPWLMVGGLIGLAVAVIMISLGLTIYLTRCRRKNKFTTPIEETGGHSVEEQLIH